jgi:hypothetical protein
LAVGSWQLAVGSWQLSVISYQLAVGSYQLAVGGSTVDGINQMSGGHRKGISLQGMAVF